MAFQIETKLSWAIKLTDLAIMWRGKAETQLLQRLQKKQPHSCLEQFKSHKYAGDFNLFLIDIKRASIIYKMQRESPFLQQRSKAIHNLRFCNSVFSMRGGEHLKA